MSTMPNLVADQNNKLIDAKLLTMNKSLAAMDAKIAANMDADKIKQQPVQLVLAEIQKMRADTNQSLQSMRTEMNQSLQTRDKLQASAYEEAVKEEYRFYTYGDAMLIL
jgi:S-adenosylmethionine:tRNA-ribosyltransferase-isomerase (queuine synthetase)